MKVDPVKPYLCSSTYMHSNKPEATPLTVRTWFQMTHLDRYSFQTDFISDFFASLSLSFSGTLNTTVTATVPIKKIIPAADVNPELTKNKLRLPTPEIKKQPRNRGFKIFLLIKTITSAPLSMLDNAYMMVLLKMK